MKRKLLIIIVSLAVAGINIQAQQRGGGNFQGARPGGGQGPAEGKISGKIIDTSTDQPVEYASVAIYRVKDSTLVTGGVTNSSGDFSIESIPYGKFYAKVTFLGYQKKTVDNIMIVPNQKVAALGTVKLDVNSTRLGEVVVTGTTNQVDYKIDKKVVNISSNLTAAGGTVVDALQNTPSIQTDVEGNVTLRGSSSFMVLIDGKPSVIQGSEALQQIPAGLVQNVEIITNPSAKYDAEGSAGIINVVMKKQKVKGFNGSISLSTGVNKSHKNNDNINLNYKVDKLNFSLGLDFSDFGSKTTGGSHYQVFNTEGQKTLDQTRENAGSFSRKGGGVRGGVEYSIDNKNSISLTGRWGNRSMNRPSTVFYSENYPLLSKSTFLKTSNSGKSSNDFYNLNFDYNLNLNEKGQQLSFSANYSHNLEESPSDMLQDTTDNLWQQVLNNGTSYNINEKGNESEYRFKADYSYQINPKTRLESGLQSQIEDRDFDRSMEINKVPDASQTNGFLFKHYVSAGYVTFSNSNKILDYQLGLRAEHENRDIRLKLNGQVSKMNRLDFFPTVHITKQLPWDLQAQASYSRRISRPRDWILVPYNRLMDPKSVRLGNPDILPELTDAYELNMQKKINDMSFVSLEGFYRKTKNSFQMETSADTLYTYSKSINLGKEESIGGEMMLNIGLTKWWSITGSGSLYNRGIYLRPDSVKRNTEWNFRGNTVIRFNTGTSLQINVMYNAASLTTQGSRGASYMTSMAIRQDLFKRKANLTLQIRDFIGSMKNSMDVNTPTLISNTYMKRESKIITLTFTYRINNYKAEKRRTPEASEDQNMGNDPGSEGMM